MNYRAEAGRLRSALVRVAELLEDGDPAEALEFATAAMEPVWPGPIVYRVQCPFCGQQFEWPGLLERHQTVVCSRASEAA